PSKEAVHNTNYWFGVPYLGLGPGAHSFDGKTRSWNIPNNQTYMHSAEKGIPDHEKEELTEAQSYNEYVMTRLRTVWGISFAEMEHRFSSTITTYFFNSLRQQAIKKEWLQPDA